MLYYFDYKMFNLTSKFALFRGTFLSAVQKFSYKTSTFNSISQETKILLPEKYEYDINVELSNRLSSIPYERLLKWGEDALSKDLVSENNKALAHVMQRTQKVFDYNVKKLGKKIRSIGLLKAYCTYCFAMDDTNWNAWDSDGWKKAVVLAWCVELLNAYFLMIDDVADQSVLRRGQSCWYKLPDVGLGAILEGVLLHNGTYKLLQKHFGSSKCYNDLVQEFLQVTEKSMHGESLDLLFKSPCQGPELFTFERYNTIAEYKTSHHTFCLPVHLAMHLVGGYSKSDFDFATQLGLKLGLYYQMQNDFMECFGDPEVTGKCGSDIQEGKCTWFAVKFLDRASDSEKTDFVHNYGRNDDASISKILSLYNSSSLQEEYERSADQLASEILEMVESNESRHGGLFKNLLFQIRKIKTN